MVSNRIRTKSTIPVPVPNCGRTVYAAASSLMNSNVDLIDSCRITNDNNDARCSCVAANADDDDNDDVTVSSGATGR